MRKDQSSAGSNHTVLRQTLYRSPLPRFPLGSANNGTHDHDEHMWKPKSVSVTSLAIHCWVGERNSCTLPPQPLHNKKGPQRREGESDFAEERVAAGEEKNERWDGEESYARQNQLKPGSRSDEQDCDTFILFASWLHAFPGSSDNACQAWNHVS